MSELNNDSQEKVMLAVKDVQRIMGIGRDASYVVMNSNSFPTVKVGKKLYVHKEVLDKWLKGEKLTSRRF